ncbi:hypothetical protein Val02_08680 [Virgisporangium aliadipatigenens]|uniref:DUF1707 domain-containing protein n=1 Tax=Virgisporangium aliadipatigenens TaxID=741659 RepID=A0A8J3YGI0_9ACTN|nr:DUF1707 domain-containing protein [Virgisporangium aliadipatigenens]GIJ43982.1 hypothetical protein Val02_08680 [Virgisporangium aliadipatigenens]
MSERVGHAQRDAVRRLIERAVGNGYLDASEYDARVRQVLAARTDDALRATLEDLPPAAIAPPRATQPSGAVAGAVLGLASLPLVLCGGIGGVTGAAAAVLAGWAMDRDGASESAVTGVVTGLVSCAYALIVVAVMVVEV